MKAIELKFVLKLLGFEGYRAPISKIDLNKGTPASKRNTTCQELAIQELVAYSREVSQFKIEPAGEALLKQDTAQLPLSEQQLAVLRACAEKSISPGKVSKVPSAERQAVIQDLEAKGLLKATKDVIKEVWLTERGKAHLTEDCNPSGTGTISLNLLQNYLKFLRKQMRANQATIPEDNVHESVKAAYPAMTSELSFALSNAHKLSDMEVLELIQQLDHDLGTGNYLPIFHLRQKLQPPFLRSELDEVLYRLQGSNAIELSSLQEADAYAAEQIDAGIPQNIGGPLFYVTVSQVLH